MEPGLRQDIGSKLTVGLSGFSRHASVALTDGKSILGVCEQERVTRVRAAGFNSTGLPDEALDLLLSRAGNDRSSVARYILAESTAQLTARGLTRIDRHLAHACAAYFASPFTSAIIVICDHQSPKVTVWRGSGSEVTPLEWGWSGIGFSDLYSKYSRLMGFGSDGDQRFEALARLMPDGAEDRLNDLFKTDGGSLFLELGWEARVPDCLKVRGSFSNPMDRAFLAAALQRRLAELLMQFLGKVRSSFPGESLCLGGSFFCHSSINSFVRSSGLYNRVFIPVDPGDAGLAVGAALHECGISPRLLSPFLGPAYTQNEIKATLENCKIPYTVLTEAEALETAVTALQRGRLVGWYEGGMEWGQRALGARSILANPFAPYVLENLNRFLKHREPWRGYALSVLRTAAEQHFEGPSEAPFMECDFRCRDYDKFHQVLPSSKAAIRVHIAGDEAPAGFRRVLEAFGVASGVPCLVNTSFNGFHEPIVCSPRDAIRVFYSTGIDLLMLDRFLLTK